jgi:hypothetical protein
VDISKSYVGINKSMRERISSLRLKGKPGG